MPAKKQITKEMILSASLKLLKSKGIEAVNVKTIAKSLDCSTQPIYLSFDSMTTLRTELQSLAIDEFLEEIGRDNTTINLYGIEYIEFAEKERELFRFLFMRQNAFSELRKDLSPIIDNSISNLMKQYGIEREEAHIFHDQLWVHAHGIATMIVTGFCTWDMAKVRKMLSECERYLGWKYKDENVL